MADESFELEDGELVVASAAVNRPSSSAADVHLRAQLHEAATVLRHRGQPDLARLALGLVETDLRDAMWVLDDEVRGGGDPALLDTFRHMIRGRLQSLQETGYDEHVVSEAFPSMVLEAAQVAARLALAGGAVPASAAAVRSLEKQTFRAAGGSDDDGGVAECSICFEDFVDGDQVSVMPCPSSRVHKFHSDCISKWLVMSNMCPLCRHELPAYYEDF